MCVAVAIVTNLVRIYTFPFGGSVTLFSMLFIVLPSWLYGVREGSVTGLIFGVLQFIIEPFVISPLQFILDYLIAFSIMGTAGIFRNRKNGLITGYIVAVISRWIIATLAGLEWFKAGSIAWEGWSPLPYSMAYNAVYIFAEAVITVIILLIPAMQKAMENVRHTAVKQR